MKKLTLDNKEFTNLVAEVCRQVGNSGWRPDYIVGLTRGGLQAAVMMSHYFDVPMRSLEVSLRDGGVKVSACDMSEEAFGYIPTEERGADGTRWDPRERRNILIVDDINDTGATLDWIIQDWQTCCLPDNTGWNSVWGNNVKFAVLIDNLSSKFSRKVDYHAMEINKAEEDVWIEFPYEVWWKECIIKHE
jgi:hypoxanthine phosphoribosyltransferase